MTLRAVKPHYTKVYSMTSASPCHGDAISMVAHILVMIHTFRTKYVVHEMPVFKPNDYFWKNHWDGKEDKWKTYARAVRSVMIENGGF